MGERYGQQRHQGETNRRSGGVALESRQIHFEMQKELQLATEKQRVFSSRAPLRIVSLLLEGTSIQLELKLLI